MPTAYARQNFVQEQQLVPQQQGTVSRWAGARKTEAKPSVSHEHDMKYFTIHNAANNAIEVEAPTLDYKVMKSRSIPGEYRVTYNAKGDDHVVGVKVDGQQMLGTPFALKATPATLDHDMENGRIVLKNIHVPEAIQVDTNSLPFEMLSTANDDEYVVQTYPHYNGGVHDVEVSYKGKVFKNGRFKMAPHPNRVRQQQMLMAAQPQPMRMIMAPQMAPHPMMQQQIQQQQMQMQQHPMMMAPQPMMVMSPHGPMMMATHQQPMMMQQQPMMAPQQQPMMAPQQTGSAMPFQQPQNADAPPMFRPPY